MKRIMVLFLICFSLISSGCVYKTPSSAAEYGTSIVRRFLYDYKIMSSRDFSTRYRIPRGYKDLFGIDYYNVNVGLKNWTESETDPILVARYNVVLKSKLEKKNFLFTLYFWGVTYTEHDLKDCNNWLINWEYIN